MEEFSLHFRIDSIRVLEFYQQEPEQPIVSGEEHAVNIGLKVQTDKDKNIIRIVLQVDVRLSDRTSLVFTKIVTAINFKFMEGQLFDANAEAEIPKVVLNLLTSIAYSTTRGILFAKVGFSSLVHLILPLIDIKEITDHIKPIDQVKSNDDSG